MPAHTPAPVLSAEQAAFIQGGVALDLASCDARNIPRIARALCCRVSGDRRRVTLLLANRAIDAFLDGLRQTGAIAAVFCLASTHRAMQLKGNDARIEPTLDSDTALVERAVAAFAADLIKIGFEDAHARVEMTYRPHELIAIAFTPAAAYEQTPGPKAGTAL